MKNRCLLSLHSSFLFHARAGRIAPEHIIIDGHIDVPCRLRRYEENITKILGGNLLRVWNEVERVAE